MVKNASKPAATETPPSVQQTSAGMKFLFIGGPPRSGTTALAHLLNRHPKIAIGIERYKYLYRDAARNKQIDGSLFEAPRFFDIREIETNVKSHAYKNFHELQRKFDQVYYRGDKLPGVFKLQPALDRGLRRTRYVFIYRDIERVCSSWNVRAHDEGDQWPVENDYRVAVQRINTEFRRVLPLATAKPKKFILVNYEQLFGEQGQIVLTALLDRLGLRPHPAITNYLQQNLETYRSLQTKPLQLDDEQRRFIQTEFDWDSFRKLMELAVGKEAVM